MDMSDHELSHTFSGPGEIANDLTHIQNALVNCLLISHWSYETCQESTDTSRVGRQGKFLCLLWQHCRRP